MLVGKQIQYCKDVDIQVDAIPVKIPEGVFHRTLQAKIFVDDKRSKNGQDTPNK